MPSRRPWTLRRRLVATVVVLLLATAVVLGVTSTLALRGALVDQLDAQLIAASERSERGTREPPPRVPLEEPVPGGQSVPDGEATVPEDAAAPPFLAVAGQRTGTVGVALDAEGAVDAAAYLDEDAAVQPLDSEQAAVLAAVPADGVPRTVDVPGLGEVRAVSRSLPSGEVLVTGLSLAEVRATQAAFLTVEAAVVAVALVVAGVVAAVVVRRSVRPLERMAATATRVSELPLHSGEVSIAERLSGADTDPATEVGEVGAALNRMLGHVESALTARHASEMQVRQFVADASHELRTPLAAIRGYAELVRRNPDGTPEETLRAVARVESEAVRMGGLVEDLLLLARLDAGRPLAREEVDVAALAVDAVADAHAAWPGHRWRLDVPDEGVVVEGDAPRLHQVLANLLANAGRHTPPGTGVLVRVRSGGVTLDGRAGPGAVVEVHDDGPGIAEDLQPVLFERFSRGDGARTRASGSSGLGLAIARAVVLAHEGTIAARSEPGSTTFTVVLPAQRPHR